MPLETSHFIVRHNQNDQINNTHGNFQVYLSDVS